MRTGQEERQPQASGPLRAPLHTRKSALYNKRLTVWFLVCSLPLRFLCTFIVYTSVCHLGGSAVRSCPLLTSLSLRGAISISPVACGSALAVYFPSRLERLIAMLPPVPPWANGNTPEPVSLDVGNLVDVTPYVRFAQPSACPCGHPA